MLQIAVVHSQIVARFVLYFLTSLNSDRHDNATAEDLEATPAIAATLLSSSYELDCKVNPISEIYKMP